MVATLRLLWPIRQAIQYAVFQLERSHIIKMAYTRDNIWSTVAYLMPIHDLRDEQVGAGPHDLHLDLVVSCQRGQQRQCLLAEYSAVSKLFEEGRNGAYGVSVARQLAVLGPHTQTREGSQGISRYTRARAVGSV